MMAQRDGQAGLPDSGASQGRGDIMRATADFPMQLTSPGRARAFLRGLCSNWDVPRLATDAEMVVSELVANAVRHGRGGCEVSVLLRGDTLTIGVRDHGMTLPRLLHAQVDELGGRGLLIVNALSRRWGSTPTDDGKLVWADLAVP